MAKKRYHLAFIDDDPWELDRFRNLYEGDDFRVTVVQAQHPASAVAAVNREIGDAQIDLFVLDLFFPAVDNPPKTLNPEQKIEMMQSIEAIEDGAQELKRDAKSNELLRRAHALMFRTGRLLENLCVAFRQSPEGGIALLEQLEREYRDVPKVFYSRKATLKDAKLALAAGALDIFSKPDPEFEHEEAHKIVGQLRELAERRPPNWASSWLKKALTVVKEWGPSVMEVCSTLMRNSKS